MKFIHKKQITIMGKIQVGQKRPKTVDMGGFTIAPNDAAVTNKGISAEEKAKQIEKIMQLPKEQIVPELRKRGFNEIADVTEVQMKEQAEKNEQIARANRLAEIKALPEEEQLPLLLEEGFENEAKELSERLAKLSDDTPETTDTDVDGDQNDEGDGESKDQEHSGDAGASETSGDGETTEKEDKEKSAPKRGGRNSRK